MANIESLTDIMLHNNPLDITPDLAGTNGIVIDKIKSEGKNITMNSIDVSSIYQMEPSQRLKNN